MRTPLYARIIVWSVPVGLALWIAQQNLALFGPVTVRCTADHCARQFKGIAPKERETLVGTPKGTNDSYMVFSADPFSFDVSLARSMRAATVSMTYQQAGLGNKLGIALSSKGGQEYTTDFSDTSELIRILEGGWGAVRTDGVSLFQKPAAGQRTYATVEEFLHALPDLTKVSVYNFDLSPYVSLASYVPSAAAHTDAVSLRGDHSLLTYVGKDEDLDVRFTMQDANRNKGKDDVAVTVHRNDTEVHTDVIPDDGNQSDGGIPSKPREYVLHLAKPGEGQYRIVFDAGSDDVFIRSIVSKQKYLVWDKKLYLAGGSEYASLGNSDDRPLTVYVRGNWLKATTTHDKSLQTVKVGDQELVVTKRLEPAMINIDPLQGLIPVTIQRQDLVLETDGAFVLNPSEDFSLFPRGMGQLTGSDSPAPYSYVLARYAPVAHDGTWNVAAHQFDPAVLSRSVHVALRGEPPIAPGSASIRVKEISVTFSARSLKFSDLTKGFMKLFKQ